MAAVQPVSSQLGRTAEQDTGAGSSMHPSMPRADASSSRLPQGTSAAPQALQSGATAAEAQRSRQQLGSQLEGGNAAAEPQDAAFVAAWPASAAEQQAQQAAQQQAAQLEQQQPRSASTHRANDLLLLISSPPAVVKATCAARLHAGNTCCCCQQEKQQRGAVTGVIRDGRSPESAADHGAAAPRPPVQEQKHGHEADQQDRQQAAQEADPGAPVSR